MAEKNSFILYFSYQKHLSLLSDEDCGKLLKALFDYAENGHAPDLTGAAAMAFSFIKDQMDRDANKYAAVCERNRINGAKGGRPQKATEGNNIPKKPKITERFSGKPKKPDNDYDNEYEYDSDSDIIPPLTPVEGKKQHPIPFEEIMCLYNRICVSFPKILRIDGKRQQAVAARWKIYSSLETFKTLFEKTEASSFLKGQNNRNWTADFDWIMKPTNITKILEGKYDDKDQHRADNLAPRISSDTMNFDNLYKSWPGDAGNMLGEGGEKQNGTGVDRKHTGTDNGKFPLSGFKPATEDWGAGK